jgi:hypothetical protein
MKLLTHCPECLRDLRDLDCDDNCCPICDADIVDWDNYEPGDTDDSWAGGFAENH